jgi:plastocyanin
MRPLRHAAPAACALTLFAVAPAHADQRVVAAPVNRYVTPRVTIAPGELLTFASQDPLAPHNVVARNVDIDGEPLFASGTIRNGEEAPVAGAEDLAAGSYPFYCTIHPAQMNGTLTVSGQPISTDATPPVLRARVASSSLRTVARRGTLLVRLTTDEAVSATVTARAFGTTLARRSVLLDPGAHTVAMKLKPAALQAVRSRSRMSIGLTLSAQDGEGNPGAAAAKRTLRR